MVPEAKADREQRVLDAAATLIMRYGFDKTTMRDVAAAAGLGRSLLYLHFSSKEDLLEAVIAREVRAYERTWHDYIVSDPGICTIGGIYRAVAHAINASPFMTAMLKRDRQVFGRYLRRAEGQLAEMQVRSVGLDTLRDMQDAGAVRPDVDPRAMAYVMDLLAYGLASADEFPAPDAAPPFPIVLETIADMLDRMLTPADGGKPEAGRAVILRMVERVHQRVGSSPPTLTR